MNIAKKVIFTLLILASFSSYSIERQLEQNWCWAASIQDVLRQAGVNQTQQQIATVLDGWPRNRPAHRPASPGELYQTLAGGWKLIAFVRPSSGAVGHFIVLQGINNQGGVIVSDPWTGHTYVNSLNQLYHQWRWGGSVVVGATM